MPAQFFYICIQRSFGYFDFRMVLTDDVERLSLFQLKLQTCTCRTASACIFRCRWMRQESGYVFIDKWLEGRTVPRTVVRILVRTFSGINALDSLLGFVRESAMIFDFLANCRFVFASVSAMDFLEELFSIPYWMFLRSSSVKCKYLLDAAMVWSSFWEATHPARKIKHSERVKSTGSWWNAKVNIKM